MGESEEGILIKSMTGFGSGEFSREDIRISVEIKSVNNRYRDIVLRIPRSIQAVEEELKSQIGRRVQRGRAEVSVLLERTEGGEGEYDMEINLPLVQRYLKIFEQLHERFGLSSSVRADELCRIKDVIVMKPVDLDLEKIREGVQSALAQALDSHDAMRVREGRAIGSDLLKRLEIIEGYLKEIEGRAPDVVTDYRKRLLEKVQGFAGDVNLDENRLLQEVAYFADRCDITEETVRAFSHLDQFRRYMMSGEPVGRRLDFLIQEINREANTIGSKASDALISAKAVEIKAELEKIREQVQNVE